MITITKQRAVLVSLIIESSANAFNAELKAYIPEEHIGIYNMAFNIINKGSFKCRPSLI